MLSCAIGSFSSVDLELRGTPNSRQKPPLRKKTLKEAVKCFLKAVWFWEVFYYVLSLLFHLLAFESILGVEFCCQLTHSIQQQLHQDSTQSQQQRTLQFPLLWWKLCSHSKLGSSSHGPKLCQDTRTPHSISPQVQCQVQHSWPLTGWTYFCNANVLQKLIVGKQDGGVAPNQSLGWKSMCFMQWFSLVSGGK